MSKRMNRIEVSMKDVGMRAWRQGLVALGIGLMAGLAQAADPWTVAGQGVLVGEPRVELSAVVPGGRVDITRQYAGEWRFNPEWDNLALARAHHVRTTADCRATGVANVPHLKPEYTEYDPSAPAAPPRTASLAESTVNGYTGQEVRFNLANWDATYRYCQTLPQLQEQYILGRGGQRFDYVEETPEQLAPARYVSQDGAEQLRFDGSGYRWSHVDGDWAEYDPEGRLVRWGNRSGELAEVRVTSAYRDGQEQLQILDRYDRLLFTLDRTPTLWKITDSEGRWIRYEANISWPADLGGGTGTRFTDVSGIVWLYRFAAAPACPQSERDQQIGAEYPEGLPPSLAEPAPASKPKPGGLVFTHGPYLSEIHTEGELRFWARQEPRTLDNCLNSRFYKYRYHRPLVARAFGFTSDRTQPAWSYDEPKKDGEHWSLSAQSAEGVRHRRQTDERGRLTRWEINDKPVLVLARDARSRTETDSRGRSSTTTYNEWHQVIEQIEADGSRVQYDYDPATHWLQTRTDARGHLTRYGYNAQGWLTEVVEAEGSAEQRQIRYAYDDDGHVTQITVEPLAGQTAPAWHSEFQYNAQGQLIRRLDGDGQTHAYERDIAGRVLRYTDPNGKDWRATYDGLGRLKTETDPLQHTTRYDYDADGHLTQVTDPLNHTERYRYDARGNLLRATDATNGDWVRQYNQDGALTAKIDPEGKRLVQYRYDEFGRISETTDGNGNVTRQDFDDEHATGGFNEAARIKYPTFAQQYEYDVRNRPLTITVLSGEEGLVTRYSYDPEGRVTRETDPEGKRWEWDYDALGRQQRFRNRLRAETGYAYDHRDRLVALTNAKGDTTRFAYDGRDNLTEEVRPLGQRLQYRYDAAGRIAEQTDSLGQRRIWTYDDAGRPTRIDYYRPAASGETLSRSTQFGYDDAGYLTSWQDGTLAGSYSYDAAHRVRLETVTVGDVTLSVQYQYTANGQLNRLTYPDGLTVSFDYDAANQLAGVTIPGEGRLSVDAYHWTVPKQLTLPGGTRVDLHYNALLAQTGQTVVNAQGQPLLSLSQGHNTLNNITRQTRDGVARTYGYDDEQRLTQAAEAGTAVNWTLDALGNRIVEDGAPWTFDANNRLLATADETFTYDDNGNLTTRTRAGQTTHYRYDDENRLSAVEDGQGQIIARYGYDPFDRRLWAETAQGRRLFVYGTMGLLAETDAQGRTQVSYGWHPDSTWQNQPLFLRRAGLTGYYQTDDNGTPLSLVSRDGERLWAARYTPFGDAQIDSATIASHLRFPGQYFDAETGLHYNLRRTYDPKLGRYLTEDPIRLGGGVNYYAYADHDPVNLIDPTGECGIVGC